MQHYKLIEIFTDEEARWQGEPLYKRHRPICCTT